MVSSKSKAKSQKVEVDPFFEIFLPVRLSQDEFFAVKKVNILIFKFMIF